MSNKTVYESIFVKDLEDLINKHSVENSSNTPDFLLAEYMFMCLNAYETIITSRDKWYDFKPFSEFNQPTQQSIKKRGGEV